MFLILIKKLEMKNLFKIQLIILLNYFYVFIEILFKY